MGLRLTLMGRAWREVHLLAGVFLVFCGTVLAWTAADMALDYRSALELRGVVVAKEMVRADADGKGTRFVARHRVALPGGETRDIEEDLPRQAWEARAIGSEHGILYLPAQGRALPTAGGERAGAAIMGAIGLVLLVGGALLARAPARALVARLRLVERGVRGTAVVADIYQTSTAVNRMILWRLRYRYRSPGGSELEGESELLTPAEAGAWQVGSEGEILLDPERSASSVWLGCAPGAHPGAALRKAGRWVLNLALFFAALFVAAVAAELIPELRSAEAWMEARRDELLMVTIGASLAGIFLLVGAVIVMLMEGGEPVDHTGVENQQRSMRDAGALPYAARASTYRLFGKGAGASAHDEFSLAEVKRALASGTALREPLWRRRACAAAGGLLIFLGVFGLMIVVTPLALKLLLAVVVLYALARIAWAVLRASDPRL